MPGPPAWDECSRPCSAHHPGVQRPQPRTSLHGGVRGARNNPRDSVHPARVSAAVHQGSAQSSDPQSASHSSAPFLVHRNSRAASHLERAEFPAHHRIRRRSADPHVRDRVSLKPVGVSLRGVRGSARRAVGRLCRPDVRLDMGTNDARRRGILRQRSDQLQQLHGRMCSAARI